MVEFYAANPNDLGDYYIGEEFDLANHDGFRRMDNPSSDGSSLNCWNSGAGNVDVHYSSGIGNHFFYLLAEGSGARTIGGKPHNSTTCNGSTLAGIGAPTAARIWFRALDVYMTSSTNYAGARTATLNAARGPLRHRQRAVQRGCCRLECRQRRLIAPSRTRARAGRNRCGPSSLRSALTTRRCAAAPASRWCCRCRRGRARGGRCRPPSPPWSGRNAPRRRWRSTRRRPG